jgi:hypothetical protein
MVLENHKMEVLKMSYNRTGVYYIIPNRNKIELRCIKKKTKGGKKMVDFILTSGLVQIKREYDEKFGFDTEVFGGDPIVVKWDGDTKIEYYSIDKCKDGKLEVIRYSGPAMDQISKIEVYISKEKGIDDKELKERLNKISINILDKYGC